MTTKKPKLPKVQQAKIDAAIDNYKGSAGTLATAIGMYMLGRRFGWKVLYLMSDKRSIRKWEDILDLNFRDELPAEGDKADKAIAWKLAKDLSNFWIAVSGELKVKIRGKEKTVRSQMLE
jgi:hypothetical protein